MTKIFTEFNFIFPYMQLYILSTCENLSNGKLIARQYMRQKFKKIMKKKLCRIKNASLRYNSCMPDCGKKVIFMQI